MKKYYFLICASTFFMSSALSANIGYVNVQKCMENSLQWKSEKLKLEDIKSQFTSNMGELEKELQSLSEKLQNEEYLESLSSSAINELKQKFSSSSQEYQAHIAQFNQFMTQMNYQAVSKVVDSIKKTTSEIRESLGLSLVLNEELVLASSNLQQDITDVVVSAMNTSYEQPSLEK